VKSINVLLLSRSDVVGLELSTQQVVQVIEQALVEHAAGTVEMHPKIGVHPTETDPANFFHAMPAYLHEKGRDNDAERIVAIPIGMSICDIALAQLTFRTAQERRVGQVFRLA
jgi:ornithine cyclodeaminase/alanine dehydrogenase-like protein (mu-crystallin family)